MALLEWGAMLGVTLALDTELAPAPVTALYILLPWCIYAVVDRGFKRPITNDPTPDGVYRVLACGLTAALASALALSTIDSLRTTAYHDPMRSLFTYALGDLSGILVVFPLVMLAREYLYFGAGNWRDLLARGWVFVPAALVALVWLPLPAASVRYPVIVASFLLYYIAFRHGLRAGNIALILLSGMVHAADAILLTDSETNHLHLLVAGSGFAALLVGVSSDALRTQGRALASTVNMLSVRTQALREAANRLASEQEEERRHLGNELHDELGQDMTAIATRLRVAEHNQQDPNSREELQSIGRLVSSAQTHLRNVLNHLHPLSLDRFGLSRALAAGSLAEMARQRGIDYRCVVDEEVSLLSPEVSTALYRICQEATTNGVKHGCGGRIHIHLLAETTREGVALSLRIEDDAGTLAVPANPSGRGLQGIRDRANALGAVYKFNAQSGVPRHWLYVNLPPQQQADGAAAL